MDLFELSATLGLDTSGFTKGMQDALSLVEQYITYTQDIGTQKVSFVTNSALDFFKSTLDVGLEYDRNLTAVYALTGATDDYSKKLFEQTVISEAAASTFTTAEVAAAGTYEALAGWDLQESAAALHGIIVTAEAAGENLKPISDIITDTTSAFHESSDRALHYGDVFASAATNANTNIVQMGEALKIVGPIAGAMGYSIEDVAVWLQLMGDNAIKSGQAGRALRNFITRLGTDAGASSTKLGALGILTEELGVQFFDAEGNARPLLDVTNELRDSWQGLDDVGRNQLLESLGSADTAYQTLQADIEKVNELRQKAEAKNVSIDDYNNAIAQAQEIIDSYAPLFEALNIDVERTNMWNLLDILGTKFSGLNDQQQLEYGKQMSSLQGMAALIAVMNTNADDYNDAISAAYNAEGAADKMREERLNSLAGDLDKLNSRYNSFQTFIYTNAKSPFRGLVQFATESLEEIQKAFGEEGLQGGLDTFVEKLDELLEREDFNALIETAGEVLGKILDGALNVLEPKLKNEFAPRILGAFFTGFGGSASNSNVLTQFLLNTLPKPLQQWLSFDSEYKYQERTKNYAGVEVPVSILPKLDPDLLADTIDYAWMEGKDNVDLGLVSGSGESLLVTKEAAQAIVDELRSAGEQGGKEMSDAVYNEIAATVANGVGKPTRSALSDAGRDGGADLTSNVSDRVTQDAPGIGDILSAFIGNSGDTAGSTFATLFGGILGSESYGMRNDLESVLGDAGSGAGWDIARDIQSALNFANFTVRVVGVVSQVINTVRSIFSHNASAMSSGRIYTKPTVFGYYDNAYQVAGDAGPEAVVGVNSLQRMITNAVHSAGAGQEIVVPRNQSRDLTVILELDRQQMGKMVYKLNNEETQRVGVKLSRGGAY